MSSNMTFKIRNDIPFFLFINLFFIFRPFPFILKEVNVYCPDKCIFFDSLNVSLVILCFHLNDSRVLCFIYIFKVNV